MDLLPEAFGLLARLLHEMNGTGMSGEIRRMERNERETKEVKRMKAAMWVESWNKVSAL